MARAPECGPVPRSGCRTSLRENVPCVDGVVPGSLGTGARGLVHRPTYKQAKRLAWVALKKMTRDYWAAKPNESELRIELVSGGRIALCGADNYDALRGRSGFRGAG